jgi:replication-associated recombination protein RarA
VGKVDDMRALTEEAKSVPFVGRYRVFILEEAQRVTEAAADALLVPMETCLSTVWILTSSEPAKLPAAIRSRCAAATFDLKPLNRGQLSSLVRDVLLRESIDTERGEPGLTDFLWKHGITAPREILGVLDQYLAGVPLEEAIHGSEHEPLYPEIATTVLSGNWTKTSALLKKVPTGDYRAMVAVVSAKLSWALLDSDFGPRADALATCLVGLGNSGFADGVAYSSLKGLLYKACKALGAKQ